MTIRERDAKRNILFSLICQMITILCGLITPRCLLLAYGSELNGAVSSSATFLGYIALLEGGIGGVARATLYKPIADQDNIKVGKIQYELNCFFQRIGVFFAFYVLILAISFKNISHTDALDAASSFWLVIAVSISIFAQYFIGISNTILIIAKQKQYVVDLINSVGIITNTLCIVVLTRIGCDLVTVRFISGFVFALRPVCLALYVRKRLGINPIKNNEKQLKDKWVGLGQHLAYYLHNHTDIVVLTLFADLKTVSVYGVYHMVTSAIQNVACSFYSGMEALFGNMYAKKESELLNRTFDMYETLISGTSTVLFSITAVMIVPFVKLYTIGIQDTNYLVPVFAVLLSAACWIYCLRAPYHNMVIAAGHFKQTNAASYGEAAINIILSILLVIRYGLVGVAIGTVVATAYKGVFYVVYLSKHIINRSVWKCIKHMIVNVCSAILVYYAGRLVTSRVSCSSYLQWIMCSAIVGCIAIIVCIVPNMIVFHDDCKNLLYKLHH